MNTLQHPCNISIEKKRYLQWKKLFRLLEYSSNKEKEEPILVLIWYHCEPPFWNLYFWECRFMIWNTYFIRFSGAHFSEEKKTSLQSFTLALLWNNLPFLVEYPFSIGNASHYRFTKGCQRKVREIWHI